MDADESQSGDDLNLTTLKQDERGQITFTPDGRSVITLFAGKDLTTVLHEGAHLYVSILREINALPDAPEDIRQDWERLKTFVGAESDAFTVEQEEQIARAFEAYLYEGKAPSVELAGAFARIKAWFGRNYRSLKALDVTLTDDVRGVFDRMLATDEQIAAMKERRNFAADPALLALMNEEEQARYVQKVARAQQTAEAMLLKRALKQFRQQSTEDYKDLLRKTTAEQREILEAEPLSRALHFLQKNEPLGGFVPPLSAGKLDRGAIEARFGKEYAKYLPKGTVAKDKGLPPVLVAEAFGLESADALLEGLRDHPGLEAVLARRVEAAMLERVGDMLRDGSIEREAVESLMTNPDRAEQMVEEMRAISRRMALPAPVIPAGALQDLAAQIIADTQLHRLVPHRFYVAELRAFYQVGKAVKAGDWDAAMEWKRKQLLNHFLYREAQKQQRAVDRALQKFKTLNKPDKWFGRNKYDIDFVNAARAVLAKFGLSRTRFDVAGWLGQLNAEEQANGIDPEYRTATQLQAFMAAFGAAAKPHRDLTLAEFMSLRDAVDNLIQTGKSARKMVIDGQTVDREQVVDDLLNDLDGRPQRQVPGLSAPETRLEKRKLKLLKYRARLRRAESWIDGMDKGDPRGLWRRTLFDPVNDAVNRYRVEREAAFEKLRAILEPQQERLLERINVEATELRVFNGKVLKPRLFETRAQLLGMIQHLGNASNRDKLVRGYGWTDDAVDGFLRRMVAQGILTKDDFDLVQNIWDFYEALKPMSQKANKEMYGYRYAEIPAQELETPFGKYRGGYVPAIANPNASAQGSIQAERREIENFEASGSFMLPVAERGFTKGRVQNFAAPLMLDLNLVTHHADALLKFSLLAAPVRQSARLLLDREVRQALDGVDGQVVSGTLMPWLTRTVRQRVIEPGNSALETRIANGLRFQAAAQFLMLNVSNAAQNITGLFPAAAKVGVRPVLKALGQYVTNPRAMRASVNEMSPFMRTRESVFADQAETIVRDILTPRNVRGKALGWTVKHGYFLQSIVQHVVDTATWTAARDKAIADGLTEAQAVKAADSAVRLTQGSSAANDISAAEAGRPIERLLTTFISYFNMLANFYVTEAQIALGRDSKPEQVQALARLYALGYAAPMIAANLIAVALRGAWPEDDDDDGLIDDWLWELFMLPQLKPLAAMAGPLPGAILGAGVGLLTEAPFDDRAALGGAGFGVIDASLGAVKTVGQFVTGGDTGDASSDVRQIMIALGVATGLPLGQGVGRPAAYIANVAEGDEEITGPLGFVQGLAGGPAPAR